MERVLFSHVALGLPINNFSEDNYARQVYGDLYHSILGKVNSRPKLPIENIKR